MKLEGPIPGPTNNKLGPDCAQSRARTVDYCTDLFKRKATIICLNGVNLWLK